MKNEESLLKKSIDPASQALIGEAERVGIETIWDRLESQQPQCRFGEWGTCCRLCIQGPCRINPSKEPLTKGICGATVDMIVARNLIRAIAGGTAAHSGHAKHPSSHLAQGGQG